MEGKPIMEDFENLLEKFKPYNSIIVFGAGNTAFAFSEVFKITNLFQKIKFYAVSNTRQNPVDIYGIPVRNIDDLTMYKNDSLIIVATAEKSYRDIEEKLRVLEYAHILDFTFESSNWSVLREYYLVQKFAERNEPCACFHRDNIISFSSSNVKVSSKIFMIKSHLDSCIMGNAHDDYASYLIPLQVGKSLTDQSISELQDDMGDNISSRNASFCELTGHYWIWKNVTAAWVGVCHYRRHFALTEQDIVRIEESEYDVVLPIPIVNIPDVSSIYGKDHSPEDWNCMMDVLNQMYPEYYATAEMAFQDVYYYGYNMMIARKKIFDSYCSWLFPLLFEIEKRNSSIHQNRYQSRYIGFLAERLTSLYFIHNKRNLHILWAHKIFYR